MASVVAIGAYAVRKVISEEESDLGIVSGKQRLNTVVKEIAVKRAALYKGAEDAEKAAAAGKSFANPFLYVNILQAEEKMLERLKKCMGYKRMFLDGKSLSARVQRGMGTNDASIRGAEGLISSLEASMAFLRTRTDVKALEGVRLERKERKDS